MKNADLENWVRGWNQYFQAQGFFSRDMAEPWKTFWIHCLNERIRALVLFLKGDREAIERAEEAETTAVGQIQESQRLLREALGKPDYSVTDKPIPILDECPFQGRGDVRREENKGMMYSMLTGIFDKKEARDLLESMIGSPVEACTSCGGLMVRSQKNKKFCQSCQGKGSGNKTPARQAYRRVFIKYGRLIEEEGKDPSQAEKTVRETEPYASLIRQWDIPVHHWTEKREE